MPKYGWRCGHPRTEENTYVETKPFRERCKKCHKAWARVYKAKRKEQGK